MMEKWFLYDKDKAICMIIQKVFKKWSGSVIMQFYNVQNRIKAFDLKKKTTLAFSSVFSENFIISNNIG